MLRTTGVGQKIVELLKRRTDNCRTSGIAPQGQPRLSQLSLLVRQWSYRLTPAVLPTPYDWPVWRHHSTRHTAISGVLKRHRGRFRYEFRCACPRSRPSPRARPWKINSGCCGCSRPSTSLMVAVVVHVHWHRLLLLLFLLDRFDHFKPHFYAVLCVIWTRNREAGNAVITVAQYFDSHAVVFLRGRNTEKASEREKEEDNVWGCYWPRWTRKMQKAWFCSFLNSSKCFDIGF